MQTKKRNEEDVPKDEGLSVQGRTDPKLTCLREATEALKLEVEIRSEEPGFGFWEHFHFKEGECLCEDTGDLMSETFDMEDAA